MSVSMMDLVSMPHFISMPLLDDHQDRLNSDNSSSTTKNTAQDQDKNCMPYNTPHTTTGNNKTVPKLDKDDILDLDAILEKGIGLFGPWQMKIVALLFLVSMSNGITDFVYTFTGFVPKYRCIIPFCEFPNNATYYDSSYNPDIHGKNVSYAEYVSKGISKNSLDDNSCKYYGIRDLSVDLSPSEESCLYYLGLLDQNSTELVEKSCSPNDLVFDTSIIKNSIITEFGFTCDQKYLKNIIGAIYMLGVLIGSFVFGMLSDHFGRIRTMMGAIAMVAISGGLGGISGGGPVWFAIMRFITGMATKGTYMVAFVMIVECVGRKNATLLGIAINIPYAFGGMIFAWEAYNFRDWHSLQLVGHLPSLLLLLLWFFVPESPRWLIASGQYTSAIDIINNGAKENKMKTPVHLYITKANEKWEEDTRDTTLMDLFRPVQIRIRTLILFFQWFGVAMCFYGLSYASTSLSGNPHLNLLLVSFIEIPSYIFTMLVIDFWGRRPVLSLCQLLGGTATIIAGLLADQDIAEITGLHMNYAELQILCSLIGKFGISAAYAIVYLYTAELYPTIIRTTSIGICSLVCMLGSIAGLLIEILGEYWKPAPNLVMGIIAIMAGCLVLLLPETAGKGLPETMHQAISLSKKPAPRLVNCNISKTIKELSTADMQQRLTETKKMILVDI